MEMSVSRIRWRKRSQRQKRLLLFILPSSLLLIFFTIIYLSSSPESLFPFYPAETLAAQCRSRTLTLAGDRFLWYAPHSGFSNQVAELKNAALIAGILNRTLVVPPVLDHHAVALGSCPKFRVSPPAELRAAVWDNIMELVRDRRYVSMTDIVALPSVVKTIDFRVFASMWCGVNMDRACSGPLCCAVSDGESSSSYFNQCRSLLSGLQGNINSCIYAVQDDCKTTVWTYRGGDEGKLDSFQPDKDLKKKKKISYVRKRRDIYEAFGSETATVLSFGSLFSAPYRGSELYIDIHEAPSDDRIQSLLEKIEFLPFVSEIVDAGREFARNRIKQPFLCAQLRLLDGQFKNHWNSTFSALEQKIHSLKSETPGPPLNIFIMTDLPAENWTGTYLQDLVKDTKSYKIYTLGGSDEFLLQAAKRLMEVEPSFTSGFHHSGNNNKRSCKPVMLPDIRLYVEESVCSCSSLGFVGTAGSTLAESIESMRKHSTCKL